MKTSHYRTLRIAILIMAGLYGIFFLYRIFGNAHEKISFLDLVFIIRGIIVMLVGLVIAIKLPKTNEHIFFALFLVNFAFYSWLYIGQRMWILDTLAWSVTAGSFVYSMIVYPGTSAASLYSEYFKARHHPQWYKKAVLVFTVPKKIWCIFFHMLINKRSLDFF